MTGLSLAPGLVLPLDLVTEPIGILANRGRGKSYTTHVLVEEIHDAGVPVVVLDVKGDWWGLRSSADGKADGLPFFIFGGDHADLPLEPTAGELLADLVVDERVSVVLDLSHLSKTKARSFTVAFAERLYHRNRDPLFVVVDEADVLIPQRATAETARLIGAMEDIAKRGRGRGIGMAVVTQRPQEVAKSVLDLMDTLILLGMTGPRSLKSVREWISVHVDEDRPGWSVVDTLPTLPVGTAWVWSPMHDLQDRAEVRTIRTFDSHVTPKPGQKRITPRARVDLDLETLGERITNTVERAKADDPKALRARIQQLEHELQEQQSKPPKVSVVAYPVLPEESVAELNTMYDRLSLSVTEWAEELARANSLVDTIVDANHAIRQLIQLAVDSKSVPDEVPTTRRSASPLTRPNALSTPQRDHAAVQSSVRSDVKVGKTEMNLLKVLVQHGPRSHSQLALQAGYSAKASTIGVALGKLRKAGLVEPGQPITATQAGIDWLGDDYDPLPTGQALIDYWRSRFGLTEQRVLDALLQTWPNTSNQAEVAEITGYSPTASTIGVALGKLRKVEVVTGWRISDDFAAAAGIS